MKNKLSNSAQRKAGALLSYVQVFLNVIVGLLYTPVMLRLMGQNEYGLYGTVNSAVALLGLLDLGFTSSYIKFYSKFKAEGRQDKINGFNSLFFIVFAAIALISLAVGGVFAAKPALLFDKGLSAAELKKASIMMLFLTLSTALGFLCTVFNCYIAALEKFVFLKVFSLASTVATVILNLVVLYFGGGAVGLTVVALALAVVVKLINIIYALKNLNLKFDFSNIDFGLFKSVFAFSGLIAINLFVDKVNSGIDSVLLGRFCGTAIVAVYAVGASINTYYTNFSTAISGVFTPYIHSLVNKYPQDSPGQRTALTELFIKVGRLQYMLLALIGSGFVFFGKPFIRFWAGEEYGDAYAIALVILIPSIVPLIQNVGIEIQRAQNRHYYRSYIYGAMALLNLAISIVLCRTLGGFGAALGTGIATVFANGIIMNIVYHKKININIIAFWKSILRATLGMLAPFAAGAAIMVFAKIDSIIKLVFWICVYAAVFCACVWLFSMNSCEKSLVKGFFGKIFGTFKSKGETPND